MSKRFSSLNVLAWTAALGWAVLPPGARAANPGAVVENAFSAGWAKADPAGAPPAPEPASAPLEPADGPIQAEHSTVAHMYITKQAYRYYASQYDGGELSRYMGDSAGDKPSSDKRDSVVEGSYEEDKPYQNPWNQMIPEMRHFWDCRKGPKAGLFGYDSAVNRAEKYFSGGYGLDGSYDDGWSGNGGENQGTQGDGIFNLYRNGNKAKAYWYLGHAAHLLEDGTVPAHALLYPHPFGGDAYESYMKGHFADPAWAKIPDEPVESFDALYDLFYQTTNVTNDYDAGRGPRSGADGKKDQGARRADGFTEQALREEGAVLMPLAYRRVAALYLYFYRQVDKTAPRVTLLFPGSRDANLPDFAAAGRVTLSARAVDDESGVDRRGYRFEIARREGAAWSAWTPVASDGAARAAFEAEPGSYAVRVTAVDAVGNRGISTIGYLTATPAALDVASR